jgi:outer membrane lipoprotein carrier protein
VILVVAACLGHIAAGARAADGDAVALARRLDQRHRTLTDLTARFTQTYRSGLLGREVVERGVVSIKRPGRMRWEYRDPEKKVFVSDGKTFYFYVPADKQVIVRDQAGARGLPTLLLSGQGEIVAQFELALEPGPPGLQRLRLTPREPDPEIESVALDVDARGHVAAIDVLDVQGNRSRFRFENIRENTGLRDSLFRFEIPRGVEVVAG